MKGAFSAGILDSIHSDQLRNFISSLRKHFSEDILELRICLSVLSKYSPDRTKISQYVRILAEAVRLSFRISERSS